MTTENLKETITYVITNIEKLKKIKRTEEYESINTDLIFKGIDTGKLVTINVKIDENENVFIGGDTPFTNIIRKAVGDYYGR